MGVLKKLRRMSIWQLWGNHDAAIVGEISSSWFNYPARKALEITKEKISHKNYNFLDNLSEKEVYKDKITIVHGSPRKPLTEYVRDRYLVKANLDFFTTPVTLVGHTHVPAVYEIEDEQVRVKEPPQVKLDPNCKYVINPGSVGQPRDGNPKASYALLDTDKDTLKYGRVEYSLEEVQEKMRHLEFPNSLVRRISEGL